MRIPRKLPIGIQDFESLRKDGYVYVDKTEQINRLISMGRYYFLSRPRRFGKSLLMTTIHALYSGKKELFDGTIGSRLSIADDETFTWVKHPVMHLDLNTNSYDSADVLCKKLNDSLEQWEEEYECPAKDVPFGMRFEHVIQAAYNKTGQRVVILVDEYDKPMLQAIADSALQDEFRSILKGFYGALKSKDGCIKFALLTGVTKFGKISVFSDLNNLNDISMDARFWDICGLSEKELVDNFPQEIMELAKASNIDTDKCIEELRARYDGYHFHHASKGVYNPFSVLSTLMKREFGSYWFETGTPTYLAELLKTYDYNLQEMSQVVTDADTLNSIDSNKNPISVIYQSGYLTIKSFDARFQTYTLGFPNMEVEDGFLRFLLPRYTSVTEGKTSFSIQQFVTDVENGNTEKFLLRLKSLFSDTPYELIKDLENHYQNVIWLVSKLMGFYVKAEYHTSEGRIDLLLQTSRYCYVMEFKLDGSAEEALQQISDKHYTLPFETNCQQIIRIGLNFDSKTRNIGQYLIG